MIDTIVLRLHDLKKYDNLITRMRLKKNTTLKIKTASIDVNEYQRLRDGGRSDQRQILNIMEISRTGEFLVKTEFHKQVNRSNHYAFTYRIDFTNDFIEFNFSIPKYKYGTNILMFVEHEFTRDTYFRFLENSTMEYNIKKCPRLFRGFINNFFLKEFVEDKIDLSDLEVHRIDVCYNQIFKSKEDAICYFNYQKKLKKKHSREEDGGKTDYNTSFMYATKRYSSKIYHKGTEYKKHDLKEHEKINADKRFQYFNIKKLQQFADRILRYELTIRNAELNYLFKHKIFRRDCPFWKINLKNYLRIDNTKKRNDRIAKKIGTLPDSEKEFYKKLHPYQKISKDDRDTYKYVSELINQSTHFMMGIGRRAEEFNQESVSFSEDKSLFSDELLTLCLKKLLGFINEFKIKELPNEERINLLIDNHNNSNKNKMQKADLIQFYQLLVKHGSFNEAAKFCGYSRATLYRYKNRLKKIGITENNVQPDDHYSIPVAGIDFKEYHTHLIFENPLK